MRAHRLLFACQSQGLALGYGPCLSSGIMMELEARNRQLWLSEGLTTTTPISSGAMRVDASSFRALAIHAYHRMQSVHQQRLLRPFGHNVRSPAVRESLLADTGALVHRLLGKGVTD